MPLADVQPPAGAQQRRDDTRPSVDVGQPAERADARVDEIERPLVERRRARRTASALHERRLDARGASRACAPPRARARRGRAPVTRAPSRRERDGVGADVALEVDGVEPADVTEPRHVEAHDVAQERGIVGEARDAVVGRGDVRGDAIVPVRAVDLSVVGHGREDLPGQRVNAPGRVTATWRGRGARQA